MRFTDQYKLGMIEAGEPVLPLEDSRRFLTIDRQLFGLFQVFGNGVITGWDVTTPGGLVVNISPGRGHISFLAAETTIARSINNLPPDSTLYIYAQAIEQTRFNRDVSFVSDTTIFTGSQMILLAAVTTDGSGVTSIDTSVRNDISFVETIKTLINQHRHRGGADNPTKIDLSSEVTGQLPGFRIDDIPASKVTSGRFAAARIPVLDHSDLRGRGVLTHPQLDSFVRNLSNPNVRLLGELSTVNLLQAYLAMKHIWNEVDAQTFNMLLMIPGITPDSFSDLNATTAVFDRTNHAIQGVPSLPGELTTTTIRTRTDFGRAVSRVNVDIKSALGTDYLILTKPFTETIIESFDNVFGNDVAVPGWTVQTLSSSSTTEFVTDSSKKADGAFSAKFDINQGFRIQATKTFSSSQDWSGFNEIELQIDTLSSAHGQIRMEILKSTDGSIEVLQDFLVLNTNETTSGFQTVIFDITSITRSQVDGIRIYTDSLLGWDLSPITVNIDRIRLNNNLFFKPAGTVRFRFATPQKSKWAAISWDADLNGGTISTRGRSAPNFAVFDESTAVPFSPAFTASGGDPQVSDNTNLEFEMTLSADSSKTASPIIRSITLSYITNGQSTGLTIDTTEQFLRASKLKNTSVQTLATYNNVADGFVQIDGRIDVGDVVYGNVRSVQQVDAFGTPVIGLTGDTLPLSPNQAAATEFVLRQTAFDGVATVIRKDDRTYLVTDTLNDRVLLLDVDGNVLLGLASNNARVPQGDEGLYPLTATYNRELQTVFVAWSTNITFGTVDLSKFIINSTGINIRLSNTADTIQKVQGINSELDSGNVLAIKLSVAHANEIGFFLDSQSVSDSRLFIDIASDAVQDGVNLDSTNFATLTTPRGIPMPVSPIRFIRGIFRPISVTITADGNWLIGNAKPLLTNDDGSDIVSGISKDEIVSVVEANPETGEIVFSDNAVDFSLVTFGGAIEYNERYVAVAGIVADDSAPQTSTTSNAQRAVLGVGAANIVSTTQTPATTEETAEDTTGSTTTTNVQSDLDKVSDYRGRVKIVEKRSGRVVFDEPTSDGTFAADVQVDNDGQLVVVEKSFAGTISRGRVVKFDDLGNIFFQFGQKELSAPNDVRVLLSGNLVVSS